LNELTRIKSEHAPVEENLGSRTQDVAAKILAFAAARNRDPRALTSEEKGEILQQLAAAGELERRGAAEKIAAIIGLSRSNIYYYLKKSRAASAPSKAQPGLKSSTLKARRKH
jgi:predicted transcriptional regulator YheO